VWTAPMSKPLLVRVNVGGSRMILCNRPRNWVRTRLDCSSMETGKFTFKVPPYGSEPRS